MSTLYGTVNVDKKSAYVLSKNSFSTVNDNADSLSLEDRVALQYEGPPYWTRAETDFIAQELKPYVPFKVISEYEREQEQYVGFIITGSLYVDDPAVGESLFQ